MTSYFTSWSELDDAGKERIKQNCAIYIARALAHRLCGGNPKSEHKFMFDVFNDLCSDRNFNRFAFEYYAPYIGFDAQYWATYEVDTLCIDNEYYINHLTNFD